MRARMRKIGFIKDNRSSELKSFLILILFLILISHSLINNLVLVFYSRYKQVLFVILKRTVQI